MDAVLYHGEPNGPSLTVLAALFESGVTLDCRRIDLLAGERHRLPGIAETVALDMSVEGEGPVLVVDGEAMTDAVFLAQYFDEVAGGAGLQPEDPHAHWEMLMWCRRATERAAPAAAFLGCKAYAHAPLAAMSDDDFAELTAPIASDDLRRRWSDLRSGGFPAEVEADCRAKLNTDSVEAQLADGREWLMGGFSIADLVAFSIETAATDLIPDVLPDRPLTEAWMARVKARPSVQAALAMASVPEPQKSWAPGPEINRWG